MKPQIQIAPCNIEEMSVPYNIRSGLIILIPADSFSPFFPLDEKYLTEGLGFAIYNRFNRSRDGSFIG